MSEESRWWSVEQDLIRLEPCTALCQGHSCCNCCGEAPAMHRTDGGRRFDRWDKDCCARTLYYKPKQCMGLQGKTREEWMEEDFV